MTTNYQGFEKVATFWYNQDFSKVSPLGLQDALEFCNDYAESGLNIDHINFMVESILDAVMGMIEAPIA